MFTFSIHTFCSLRPIAIPKRGKIRKSAMLRAYFSREQMNLCMNEPEYSVSFDDCKFYDWQIPNFTQFVSEIVHFGEGNISQSRRNHVRDVRAIKPCTVMGISLEDGRASLLAMVDGMCCASPVQYSPEEKTILRLGKIGSSHGLESPAELPDELEFAASALERLLQISLANEWFFYGSEWGTLENRFEVEPKTDWERGWNPVRLQP